MMLMTIDPTNRSLKALMKRHALSVRDVAALVDVSEQTVKSWRVKNDSVAYRHKPKRTLELMKLKLPKS
tara:strand:+ start:893 stop:1099 length:207 start_codon:yes stop_codon:yes gene_type:complete